MYIGPRAKYPLFLSDYNQTWIFPTDLKKITQISNFMKICPVGADLFHTDGGRTDRKRDRRVDMMKLIFTLLNFIERT